MAGLCASTGKQSQTNSGVEVVTLSLYNEYCITRRISYLQRVNPFEIGMQQVLS